MKLEEFLIDIKNISEKNNLSPAYIVGGVSRDRIIGKFKEKSSIKDIDITTGNTDAFKLGVLISKAYPESSYKIYDDNHSSVVLFGIRIDFSSHFVIPNIEMELKKMGIKNISDMKKEIYSRDFTINTILEKLDFSETFDITKEGIGDIHAGLIRCPIDPRITIGVDARRILRAIKYSIKFGFTIESRLKDAMLEFRQSLKNLPNKFVSSKIDEIVNLNPDEGIDRLIEFKILPLVPLSKMVYDILIQKKKIVHSL